MAKYAVLVVDMLEDFVNGALTCDMAKAIVPDVAKLVDAAREKNVPLFSCSQEECDHCIDSDTKPDRHCTHQILNRKYKRQCCHGIFTDLCHKKTVYNIIKCIDHHGKYHGQ